VFLKTDQLKRRASKAQEKQAFKFINKVLKANRSRNFFGRSSALNSLMGKQAMQETLMEKVARVHRRQQLEVLVSDWLDAGNLEKLAGREQAFSFMDKFRNVISRGKGTTNPRVAWSRAKVDPVYSPTAAQVTTHGKLGVTPDMTVAERIAAQAKRHAATANPGAKKRALAKARRPSLNV
jgi:hypothetical protein